MEYTFEDQLELSERYEHILDEHYRTKGIHPIATTKDEQFAGIDRYLARPDGTIVSVDYKVDFTAGTTGNMFLETFSNYEARRYGWTITSTAKLLIYYIPDWDMAYTYNMADIKDLAQRTVWNQHLGPGNGLFKDVINKGPDGKRYTTRGYPVPMVELEPYCIRKEVVLHA